MAVGVWNFVGAGIFGFLINLPIVSYFEVGTTLTPNHGHAALFGVFGMLALAVLVFCLRAMQSDATWKETQKLVRVGINRTLKVARMAEQAGLPVTPHSANLSLVTVFTLHLMGALENAGPYVEFSIEGPDYYPWQDNLYAPALIVEGGKVRIPDGPGWGVEIDKNWLAAARYQKSEI